MVGVPPAVVPRSVAVMDPGPRGAPAPMDTVVGRPATTRTGRAARSTTTAPVEARVTVAAVSGSGDDTAIDRSGLAAVMDFGSTATDGVSPTSPDHVEDAGPRGTAP